MANYYYKDGEFVIEGFDTAKPFSSFLPGLAGVFGKPLWTFYVNRGQCMCSFGVQNKDNAIMEFSPANTLYKTTPTDGFRTFIRAGGELYEPFSPLCSSRVRRDMHIRQNELIITEINTDACFKTTVRYFVLPNESFAALARCVTVENLREGDPRDIELLDGMPQLIPYGIKNSEYKAMSNLLRSWAAVEGLENGIPFFTVRSATGDEAEIDDVTGGYYYMSVDDSGKLLPPLCDPDMIFGYDCAHLVPERFASGGLTALYGNETRYENKIPCAFTPLARSLAQDEKLSLYSLIGFADTADTMPAKAKQGVCSPEYMLKKEAEANEITKNLTADVRTATAMPIFDAYVEQCYIDNLVRGGYPIVLNKGTKPTVLNLFSRKHGDPERDYNFFSIAAEYLSQGNGNFRDVNQNRRLDVLFNPDVGSANIKTFFNLVQIDGYNPLEVRGSTFALRAECEGDYRRLISEKVTSGGEDIHKLCIGREFTIGALINTIEGKGAKLAGVTSMELAGAVILLCDEKQQAVYSEGYWSDHFTYNMDLIDSYLAVYPDRYNELLFEDDSYRFFDSPITVNKRSEKYVEKNGRVFQFGCVKQDKEKAARLGQSLTAPNWLKAQNGKTVTTTLFVKLLSLSLNKYTLLDPCGMGVEMEGGKPGWNDANNGLPGLLGSGMPETFELLRLLRFTAQAAKRAGSCALPCEIAELLTAANEATLAAARGEISEFERWDKISSARELYRDTVRMGLSGEKTELTYESISEMLSAFADKLDCGIKKAVALGNGLTPTYIVYTATRFHRRKDAQGSDIISEYGLPTVVVEELTPRALPYFLEGPARMLKTATDTAQAKIIYDKVKASDIYDNKLKMYKTSGSIESEAMEIGRLRAFTPGWLERESVFLHMSYKYLLELLRTGLYDEFFEDCKTGLIPFLNPEVYGRSTLENSSFLASSANPDPAQHGRGFVARLSGSTIELLSMWREMFMGGKLFTMENGELTLRLQPVLPSWLFSQDGTAAFTLFGSIKVTYRNEKRLPTYGKGSAKIVHISVIKSDGTTHSINGDCITGELARSVRNREVEEIEAVLE